MMLKALLTAWMLFLTAEASAQLCSANTTQRSAQQAIALDRQLRSIQVQTFGGDIPPNAVAPLEAFKQALVAAIATSMHCSFSAVTDPQELQSALGMLLDANHKPKPQQVVTGNEPETTDDAIGEDLTIAVKPLPGHPDMISIQVTFGLVCGDDNVLLIYQRSVEGWREQLTWRSSKIDSMIQGFGDFFIFTPAPGGPDHPLLIAVAHGHPWCTSRFSQFDLDLLAPHTTNTPQEALAHVDGSFDRTGEPGPTIHTRSDGFELKLKAPDSDIDIFQRVAIYRYRTTSDKLQRQQPIANNARDFVDAWIDAAWAEAAEWSGSEPRSLKLLHDLFDYRLHPDASSANGVETYGAVRACTQNPTRYQVEMSLFDHTKLYAQVRLKGSTCLMLDLTRIPDANCIGPDLTKPSKPGR